MHKMGPDVISGQATTVERAAELTEHDIPSATQILTDCATQGTKNLGESLVLCLVAGVAAPRPRTKPAELVGVVMVRIGMNANLPAYFIFP